MSATNENPLTLGTPRSLLPRPCILVIFGAAGDLSWRKLLPAIYNLNADGLLPSNFAVVGFGIGSQGDPVEWFRQQIRKTYGGRAPRVLDPFAGGGAIPLEAMRLGCETTSIDINPVAWFILKCTLEYPQKLAGQTRPLPKFALESGEFMQAFLKGTGKLSKPPTRGPGLGASAKPTPQPKAADGKTEPFPAPGIGPSPANA